MIEDQFLTLCFFKELLMAPSSPSPLIPPLQTFCGAFATFCQKSDKSLANAWGRRGGEMSGLGIDRVIMPKPLTTQF